MLAMNPIIEHRKTTRDLAESLDPDEVFWWLIDHGYFPESYVLPPCFHVVRRPTKLKSYFPLKNKKNGVAFSPTRTECIGLHYPKSELTDRTFGLIHPYIHNDIAYEITTNWMTIVNALIPQDSLVASYFYCISALTNHNNSGDISFRHGVISEGSPSWIDDSTCV
jgi:hypothetical protein